MVFRKEPKSTAAHELTEETIIDSYSSKVMTHGFQIRVDSHHKKSSKKIYELFKEGNFSDCSLTLGQTVVKAHRVILCTVDYFYIMFSHGWNETISASANMTQTIPEEILQAFVDFLYLGWTELKSIDQVLQMFLVAEQFFMEVRVGLI